MQQRMFLSASLRTQQPSQHQLSSKGISDVGWPVVALTLLSGGNSVATALLTTKMAKSTSQSVCFISGFGFNCLFSINSCCFPSLCVPPFFNCLVLLCRCDGGEGCTSGCVCGAGWIAVSPIPLPNCVAASLDSDNEVILPLIFGCMWCY